MTQIIVVNAGGHSVDLPICRETADGKIDKTQTGSCSNGHCNESYLDKYVVEGDKCCCNALP